MWKHIKDNNDLLYHCLPTRFRITELDPMHDIGDDPALLGPHPLKHLRCWSIDLTLRYILLSNAWTKQILPVRQLE
jgi:hypothetical protein